MSALDLGFVAGRRSATTVRSRRRTPLNIAFDALVAAGAIMVRGRRRPSDPFRASRAATSSTSRSTSTTCDWGRFAPIQSLVEEVRPTRRGASGPQVRPYSHLKLAMSDLTPGGANETQDRTNLPLRKAACAQGDRRHETYANWIRRRPSTPVIAILGSTPSSPQAGYPQLSPDVLQHDDAPHRECLGQRRATTSATVIAWRT